MWFYYDHDGKRIGLEYQGAMYYYIYNLQGDVVAIADSNGTICGSYEYNDWGKITSISNIGSNTVATANPFRYRGYYYDSETELYYLNSRYYNPEWGRFLNADGIIGANGDVISTNLFAYCSNNPINYSDPTGMCFWCGTPGIAGEKLREAAGCTEGKKTNTIQTNNKTTQSSKNTTKPGKENKSSFDAGVNITTNDSSSTMGGFYAVADDLPYLENPETASDMYKFGLGSYRAGIGTIFHQWEYGGLGVDIMTANADFNAKNIGIGFNIMSIKGNIRIPLPSGEYTVIEGGIGIGIQLGVGKSGFEATTDFVTYGINYYIE